MIHICNVPRYQAPSAEELRELREKHVLLSSFPYERKQLNRGYTDKLLTVDVGTKQAVISDIPAESRRSLWAARATACATCGMP